MFNRGSYDIIKIQMPINGMNQNISPEALELSYAYILENIIPRPMGEGQVRYGTTQEFDLSLYSKITGLFPFVSLTGDNQLLLYVNELEHDATAADFIINDDLAHISFTTDHTGFYKKDLRIRLLYSVEGSRTAVIDNVKDVIVDDDRVIISFYNTLFTAEGAQSTASIYYDIANIYVSTDNGYFIDAVGIDDIMRTDDYDLQLTVNDDFDATSYEVGDKIQLTSGGAAKTYTINAAEAVDDSYNITTLEKLPDALVNPSIKCIQYFKLLTADESLNPVCIPRYVSFADKLLICNGVDRVKIWDGTTLVDLFQYLKDDVTQIIRDGNNQFHFTLGLLSSANNYPIGGKVKIVNAGVAQIVTIANANLVGQVLTITTTEILNAFQNTSIYYQAFPPKFSYMFSMHNRLWCLGKGAAGIQYRNVDQAQRVYFMYKKGATLEFFDERTKLVPSINLAESNSVGDNLEAIAYTSGYMFFIGRNTTQVWSGSEPLGSLVDPDKPILTHTNTFNTGTIHGDLVLSIGNDVFMMTKNGLVSCGTYRDGTVQLAVTSYNAVDPLIMQYITSITQNNIDYLETRSFRYDGQSMVGFKIGFNNVLCSIVTTTLNTWTMFSGNFSEATAFCPFKNALYLSIGNVLYKYADGKDGSVPAFGDDDDSAPVFFAWALPILKFDKIYFANFFYDMNVSYPSSFTERESNNIKLGISGDVPASYNIEHPYRFEMRGDCFSTLPFAENTDDEFGLRFDSSFHTIQDKLKFVASKFWVTVSGQTQDGIVSLKDIKFYGTIERKLGVRHAAR